ncbi:hypothetical protein B0H15DRAFT_1001818 [Mycena belliarum]|uniref:Uncharacterized protein n=1 Tax=Mycena belliarum TaxID=1033014 RepID=A0AAD6TSM0_9AGAR|nr:hypothetical protein B0H15DRAFT_1001818 [Mycena belliae]
MPRASAAISESSSTTRTPIAPLRTCALVYRARISRCRIMISGGAFERERAPCESASAGRRLEQRNARATVRNALATARYAVRNLQPPTNQDALDIRVVSPIAAAPRHIHIHPRALPDLPAALAKGRPLHVVGVTAGPGSESQPACVPDLRQRALNPIPQLRTRPRPRTADAHCAAQQSAARPPRPAGPPRTAHRRAVAPRSLPQRDSTAAWKLELGLSPSVGRRCAWPPASAKEVREVAPILESGQEPRLPVVVSIDVPGELVED